MKRVERLKRGDFGDCEKIKKVKGLRELRIHEGAGYRVYFGDWKDVIVILLCGGDKRTQKQDIKRSKEYWKEFRFTTKK